MVREENVKLMSQIAIYEKHDGKHCFYKSDYVRLNALKAVVYASVVFVLIAGLTVLYRLDDILKNIFKYDYKKLIIEILILYGIWIFAYWLIARIIYAKKYENGRSNIIIYNHNLKKLQEEAEKEVMKAKGGVVVDDDFIDF